MAFDPALWRDPAGRLWYLFNRGNKDTAEHGVYARICDKPDATRLQWGAEFRVGFDEAPLAFRLNKPTVLKTGEWILPVTHAAEKMYCAGVFISMFLGVKASVLPICPGG